MRVWENGKPFLVRGQKQMHLTTFAIIYKDTTCAKCFHLEQLIRTPTNTIII